MTKILHILHEGGIATFSWPSLGTGDGYLWDSEKVTQSERFALEFIQQLRASQPRKIHIVAHSMGNRLLLNLAPQLASLGFGLGQVILAAADVSADSYAAAEESLEVPKIFGHINEERKYRRVLPFTVLKKIKHSNYHQLLIRGYQSD